MEPKGFESKGFEPIDYLYYYHSQSLSSPRCPCVDPPFVDPYSKLCCLLKDPYCISDPKGLCSYTGSALFAGSML